MKTLSDILLVKRQTIGTVTLEIIPDLFNRIEFWCISRKPFDMQTRKLVSQLRHHGSLVNLTIVPKKDDLPSQMAQHDSEKRGNMNGVEIVLLKTHVQTHVLWGCGNGQSGQC